MTHNSIKMNSHICRPILKFFKDEEIDYVKDDCCLSFSGLLFLHPYKSEKNDVSVLFKI